MNISLLLTTLSLLSFEIKFQFDDVDHQDFFIFDGFTTTAHLFRRNDSVILYLTNNASFEIYESIPSSPITFKWEDYMINGKKMELSRSQGLLIGHEYHDFVFMSPLSGFYVYDPVPEPILDFKFEDINYGYFLLIVLGVGICLHPKLSGYLGPQFLSYINNSVRSKTIDMEQI